MICAKSTKDYYMLYEIPICVDGGARVDVSNMFKLACGLISAPKAFNILRNIEIDIWEKKYWSIKVLTTEVYKMDLLLLENMKLVF